MKAMNDTLGPEGLVPSLLIFGTLPQIPTVLPKMFALQKQRMQDMCDARLEYQRIVAQMRINLAIRRNVPPAADYIFEPGCHVNTFPKKLTQWTGPHVLESIYGKIARVHVG
jgi:hypothetical protein